MEAFGDGWTLTKIPYWQDKNVSDQFKNISL